MALRILLADDHAMVCEGISALIERNTDHKVVEICKNGRDVLDKIRETRVDLALLDIEMPYLNGIDALIKIKKDNPQIKVLIISAHDDRNFILQALREGADGYMLKVSCFKEILHAIEVIFDDHKFLSPHINDYLLDELINIDDKEYISSVFSLLTEREREILQLTAEEKSSKEISSILGVTSRTVDIHKSHIMEKLDIHTNIGLVKFAIKEGLVSLP